MAFLHIPPPPQSKENSDSIGFVMPKGDSWLCLHLIPLPQPQEATALVILWVPNPGTLKIGLWNHTANALEEMGRKAHREGSLPDVQDP